MASQKGSENGSENDRESGGNAGRLPRSVERRIAAARAILFWETVWPALWPALGLAGLFAAAALFGLIDRLPAWAHWVTLGAFAAAILGAGWRNLRKLRWPDRQAGLRFLERTSGMPHRPLGAYEDTLAPGTGGDGLWQAHKRWAASTLSRLRLAAPSSRLSLRDPYVLRAGLVIVLFVAVAGTPAGRLERLGAALWPGGGFGGAAGQVDAWITPPAYTGRPPIYLSLDRSAGQQDEDGLALDVPANSILAVRVQGGSTPTLAVDLFDTGDAAAETADPEPFARTGDGFELDHPLTASGHVRLRQGVRTVADWRIGIVPDRPPAIELTAPVDVSLTRALRLAYKVTDDYGVTGAQARVVLAPEADDLKAGLFGVFAASGDAAARPPVASPDFALPLPKLRPRDADEETYRDLTSHPWAGLPVTITLVARDDAGQEGTSESVPLVLPARPFTDPLARAIVEQRRRLALDPDSVASVARFLNAFTFDPDLYFEDASIYLALRSAYWRLTSARRDVELAGIFDLLWDIALRIEDGDLSLAERELRAARNALMEALAGDADAEEIERLMQELKQALNRYMDALSQQTAGVPPPDGATVPGDTQTIDRQDLEDMLSAIEDLARTGAREQAREMLSQLQSILENMQTGMAQQQMTPGENAMSQALDQLGDLIEQQKSLMDETFQHGQQLQQPPGQGGREGTPGGGQPGASPPDTSPNGEGGALDELGKRQQALREQLDGVMDDLGKQGADVPSALGRAGRAMRDAERRLDDGRSGPATASQGQALDQLRQGAQAMADKLLESMASRGQGRTGRGNGDAQTDPLGRPLRNSGIDTGDSVTVPDELDLQRAREILQELRRRAAELGRPEVELDYLERLLKRF